MELWFAAMILYLCWIFLVFPVEACEFFEISSSINISHIISLIFRFSFSFQVGSFCLLFNYIFYVDIKFFSICQRPCIHTLFISVIFFLVFCPLEKFATLVELYLYWTWHSVEGRFRIFVCQLRWIISMMWFFPSVISTLLFSRHFAQMSFDSSSSVAESESDAILYIAARFSCYISCEIINLVSLSSSVILSICTMSSFLRERRAMSNITYLVLLTYFWI